MRRSRGRTLALLCRVTFHGASIRPTPPCEDERAPFSALRRRGFLDIGRPTRFDSFARTDHLPLARYISFLPARDTLEDTFRYEFFSRFLYVIHSLWLFRGCHGDVWESNWSLLLCYTPSGLLILSRCGVWGSRFYLHFFLGSRLGCRGRSRVSRSVRRSSAVSTRTAKIRMAGCM